MYILDYYQFSDGVMDEITSELPSLEAHFARLGNAVLVTSVGNIDFADDVMSWHQVVGRDPSEICPAIFISSLPPAYFSERRPAENDRVEFTDNEFGTSASIQSPWIILELGKLCESKNDVLKLLKSIISDISLNKPLSDFEYTGSHEFENRPIVSGKLKYAGVQLDLQAAVGRTLKWFSTRKL